MSAGHFSRVERDGVEVKCFWKTARTLIVRRNCARKNQNVRGFLFIYSVFCMKTPDINWMDINYEWTFFSPGKMSREGGGVKTSEKSKCPRTLILNDPWRQGKSGFSLKPCSNVRAELVYSTSVIVQTWTTMHKKLNFRTKTLAFSSVS